MNYFLLLFPFFFSFFQVLAHAKNIDIQFHFTLANAGLIKYLEKRRQKNGIYLVEANQ